MVSLFLTGTDTSVGKTVIAGAIAAFLRAQGLKVGVMKPAESGCREKSGALVPADAVLLKRLSGTDAPLELICPYRLAEPLAPAIAAERAGVHIDVGHIMRCYAELARTHDVMVVEGAGGLMVPLSGKYLYLDLAAELGLPLVVVGRLGLGTINHTLLTIEAAKSRNLQISGIILNQSKRKAKPMDSRQKHSGMTDGRDAAEETNPRVIGELAGTDRVFTTPYIKGAKSKRGLILKIGNELHLKGFFA